METLSIGSSLFWVALAQIVLINILLSGDNAVVIALASRNLPPRQQRQAILFGSFGAIVLRVVLTFFAAYLLTLPYLKLAGGVLLLWIGVNLLSAHDEDEHMDAHSSLLAAVKTIIVADFVMSLDNVIGVAAAAKGSFLLLLVGLGLSIPLIIYGSTVILKLMKRFPIIITLGAGLLGYVAGEMGTSDPVVGLWIETHVPLLHQVAPWACAALVVAVGKRLSARSAAEAEALVAVEAEESVR
ncbi:MAG: TerC family protein [Pseudomonadota bacterium]